jgi:hypothetical protein
VKIALQISGRLRFTEASLGSLLGGIVEPLQPDIFFSFWQPEYLATLYSYIQALKPKSVEVEDHNKVAPYLEDLFPFNVHKNMPAMSYKFYRVSKVRQIYEMQTGNSYDVVIQARSDNLFFEKLDAAIIKSCLDNQAILCSNQEFNPIIDSYTEQPRMVDNFYLGPTDLIDKANDTFWQLRHIAQEWTSKGHLHHVRIPEIIQTKCWKDAGIKIAGLPGTGASGNFWYDIDRTETKWR